MPEAAMLEAPVSVAATLAVPCWPAGVKAREIAAKAG